jgi:CTD kinase subunit beta
VELESLMLEATSFEFDTRHPQQLVVKILQAEFKYDFQNGDHKRIFQVAWAVGMDLNLTFALLKQTTSTLAMACVELTMRLLGYTFEFERVFSNREANPYSRFSTTRGQISETLMDLLDLYTEHKIHTFAGPRFSAEDIMDAKITMNRIADQYHIPRYSQYRERDSGLFVIPSFVNELANPKKQQPKGTGPNDGVTTDVTMGGTTQQGSDALIVRRFILQSSEAVTEVRELDQYFVQSQEDYQKEHEVEDGWESYSEEEDMETR